MKALVIIVSILTLGTTSLIAPLETSSKDTITNVVTFDGYEGGYFFFTDRDQNALTLESSKASSYDNTSFKSNEVIGSKFKVIYKVAQDPNDSSTEGYLLNAEQL